MSGKPLTVARALAPPAAAALAALAVLGSSGCGTAADAHAPLAVAVVNERDFHITAPQTLKAGGVQLQVDNHGPDQHELIIAPLHGATLPMRADGFTVD